MSRAAALLVAALVALGAAGCGEEEQSGELQRRSETAQPLPDLRPGWKPHQNATGGFAFRVPPGWRAENQGIRSLVRSPDRLVAATITADRSEEALEPPLDEFADAVITSVSGIHDLEPRGSRRFRHRYEAAAVEADAVGGRKDVRQKLLLVALRREGIATLTVLVARNAERDTGRYVPQIEAMIRSLRSRPPA